MHTLPTLALAAATLLLLAPPTLADAPITTAKACKIASKAEAKRCKAQLKAQGKACKQSAKRAQRRCAQLRKDCTASANAARRAGAGGVSVKCPVKVSGCKAKAKADNTRCQQATKRDYATCTEAQRGEESICLATVAHPPGDTQARCHAECTARSYTGPKACEAQKSQTLSTCKLEHTLAGKECRSQKALCNEENRVGKLLKKNGLGGTVKDCNAAFTACNKAAARDLDDCKQTLALETCQPGDIATCIQTCVADATPKTSPTPKPDKPAPASKPTAAPSATVKLDKDGIPYPAFCRVEAIQLYSDSLNALAKILLAHPLDVEGAVRDIEVYRAKHIEDHRCVQAAVPLWMSLPKAQQEALQRRLSSHKKLLTILPEAVPDLLRDPRIQKALSFQ